MSGFELVRAYVGSTGPKYSGGKTITQKGNYLQCEDQLQRRLVDLPKDSATYGIQIEPCRPSSNTEN